MATFASSSITAISNSAPVEVTGIVFNSGASAYKITVKNTTQVHDLTISGGGIGNNSGILQKFITLPSGTGDPVAIAFRNSATAGQQISFTYQGATATKDTAGLIRFFDSSNAGSGSFTNNGGTASFMDGGHIAFLGMSSAGDGFFVNNGGMVDEAIGGKIDFNGNIGFDEAPVLKSSQIPATAAARLRLECVTAADRLTGSHTVLKTQPAATTHSFNTVPSVRTPTA